MPSGFSNTFTGTASNSGGFRTRNENLSLENTWVETSMGENIIRTQGPANFMQALI